jgi:murein DD-endopeptidase MepM/ murein hydrolase activator NlpD
MAVLGVGVLLTPVIADTYPLFSSNTSALTNLASAQEATQSVIVDEDVFQTTRSEKPRDSVITYTIQRGDTLSTIAEKFGISVDTIKWANDLHSDSITVGDSLKILPVTGILHKVQSGETVFSIAKKYNTEPQKIVEFPFNDFANPETFALVVGQDLIVPDGIKPSERPSVPVRRQVYLVQGPVSVSNTGFTWPVRGEISQMPSWYHMALDITSPFGTPIVAAQDGKVSVVSSGTWDGGYGNNVWIDNGAGLASHYAHMNRIFVSVGQTVVAGKTVIGEVGLSGRTTGPHVHFEIARNGVLQNPLPYLQ